MSNNLMLHRILISTRTPLPIWLQSKLATNLYSEKISI